MKIQELTKLKTHLIYKKAVRSEGLREKEVGGETEGKTRELKRETPRWSESRRGRGRRGGTAMQTPFGVCRSAWSPATCVGEVRLPQAQLSSLFISLSSIL